MAFVRTNDIVTHFKAEGRAGSPTLVFINSLGTDFRIWDEVAPAFTDRMHVIRYDNRGHGLSDTGSAAFTIDRFVDDLRTLMTALRVTRASIVGLSIGGMIAQGIAARDPDKVASLVLCDTAARIGTEDMWAARIGAIGKGGIEAVADTVMQRWFSQGFREERPVELAGWRAMLVRTPVEGYLGACAAIRDADLTAQTAKLTLPTLCVAGDEDGSTPPDLVRATAALIAGARFSIIQNAGHLPCIEQPSRLIQLIESHLSEAGLV